MKNSKNKMMFAGILLLSLAVPGVASAVVAPGWERPIMKARMDIRVAPANFVAREVTLVMTKQDGKREASGFVLLIDNRPINFRVIQGSVNTCGQRTFAAIEEVPANRVNVGPMTLVLVDHSRGACPRPETYLWEASLLRNGQPLLRSGGYPEAVFTIQ